MLQFFAWYVTITLLGLLTFPLAYRLLPALADRGYALSRSLGLLLWAFIFWLAASLGLTQNNVGGLLLALAVLAGLAVWANWKKAAGDDWKSVLGWLKSKRSYVLSVEILFFVAFAFWTFVRANNPELVGTEKPMEIAFINAIIHSPTFPPHDPWLSGYAISYYYFGYVMTAMLAEITFTAGPVAFNLMLALIFGLSAIGAYGLLYNLLRAYWKSQPEEQLPAGDVPRKKVFGAMGGAFLAPLFLLLVGNWEAFLDVLHKRGFAWTGNPGDVNFWTKLGVGYPPQDQAHAAYNFWTWLNILDLKDAPAPVLGGVFERLGKWWGTAGFNGLGPWLSEAFMPDRNWWWWRASRVVTDYDLRGGWNEIIDEFPAFSYVLGDLHPHVLAMPFGLLVGALALNLYLGGWKGQTSLFKHKFSETFEFELNFPVRLEGFILLAVALGGLAFLNTWDFPIYLGLVCAVLVLSLVAEHGWNWDLVEETLKFAIPLAVLSIVLYLPFYIGFSSQAGGIAPNVIFPTRASHLWIMFGGMFIPLFAFLVYLRGRHNLNWKTGLTLAVAGALLLWLASTLMAIVLAQTDIGQQLISSQGLSSTWEALREATVRRLAFGGGLLTLVLLIAGALAYLAATSKVESLETNGGNLQNARSPLPFVLIFILFGGLLVLAPDFIYLRDQFGYRMNTVFKFYYEAWALWSIAATFAIVIMFAELRTWGKGVFTGVVVLLIGIGLLFPLLSLPNKTNNFSDAFPAQGPAGSPPNPPTLTLDGSAYFLQGSADDYNAAQFLAQAAPGTIAEAVGDSYHDETAVAATYSGNPVVLGWQFHESQWRGGTSEMGNRVADIETLYTTQDWDQALTILKRYDIRYIYLSPLERSKYRVNEDKFTQHLSQIYNQGQVVIYIVP